MVNDLLSAFSRDPQDVQRRRHRCRCRRLHLWLAAAAAVAVMVAVAVRDRNVSSTTAAVQSLELTAEDNEIVATNATKFAPAPPRPAATLNVADKATSQRSVNHSVTNALGHPTLNIAPYVHRPIGLNAVHHHHSSSSSARRPTDRPTERARNEGARGDNEG